MAFSIKRGIRRGVLFVWAAASALLYPAAGSAWGCTTVYAAEEDAAGLTEEEANEAGADLLSRMDLDGVEEALGDFLSEDVTMGEVIRSLMEGQSLTGIVDWQDVLEQALWSAAGFSRKNLVQILLLAVFSSVLSGFAGAFKKRELEQAASSVTALLLTAVLMQNFLSLSAMVDEILRMEAAFMQALLPAYCLALTASDGASTAMLFYHMMLALIYVTEVLMQKILLPLTKMYFLVSQMNILTGEEFLSRMADLMKNGILWAHRTLVGLTLGIQLVGRLVSPAVDSLKRTILGRSVSAIPGVGNLFGGVAQVVLGSAVLVKNCLGAAALLLLALAAIPPLFRIGTGALSCQVIAALVQPVADKRLVESVHTAGGAIGLLLKILTTVEILFLLTIAVLAGAWG